MLAYDAAAIRRLSPVAALFRHAIFSLIATLFAMLRVAAHAAMLPRRHDRFRPRHYAIFATRLLAFLRHYFSIFSPLRQLIFAAMPFDFVYAACHASAITLMLLYAMLFFFFFSCLPFAVLRHRLPPACRRHFS
jgi:hypothetical protein